MIEKSGVGQAILHQKAMLESVGVETTERIRKDTNIVHINTVFPDSVFTALRAKLRHKKVVYYGHSTMEDFRNSFKCSNLLAPVFKRWIKFCYSLGDVIITPTEYSKGLLKSYHIKKPIYSLSNGIDTKFFAPSEERRNRFRKLYHLTASDKAVISVGHYIERKGILDFIELAGRMPEVRFFWFGYTNLNIVPAKIKQTIESAPKNLIFPGYVNRDELCDAYCGCDVFSFMSHEETEGIVVLEALSCGIPTVVRDIPVYENWLCDKVNVYKAKSHEQFYAYTAAALYDMIPNLSEQEIETANSRSIAKTGEKLISIYQAIPERAPNRHKIGIRQYKKQNDLL